MTLAMHGLTVAIYERAFGGAPTGEYYTSLQNRLSSYTHTITWHGGFETMTCTLMCGLEEAVNWLSEGLMRHAKVYGPDAEIIWEGFLETVEASFGGERRSMSVREMANRMRVRFTTVNDVAGVTTNGGDTDSQELHGVKDAVFSLNIASLAEAEDYRDAMLAKYANPVGNHSASTEIGDVQLTLSFAGWYATLDWVLTSNTSTTMTSTTTQVGTLLGSVAAVNAFIATSTRNITASGITATEFISPDTSYKSKIEALLGRGDGADPYAWGVYEDRTFYASVYAGATPSTIAYQRNPDETLIRDTAGSIVEPWNVRPNAIYQVNALLDVAPVNAALDTISRFFVARVTCTIGDGDTTVSLEPDQTTDFSAILVTRHA